MQYGMVKVGATTVEIAVAAPEENAERAALCVKNAEKEGVSLLVCNPLTLTGATAGDLVRTPTLLAAAERALFSLAEKTKDCGLLFFVGLPIAVRGSVYDAAAAVCRGEVLGLVPKTHLTAEEKRVFTSGKVAPRTAELGGKSLPFGTDLLFRAEGTPLVASAELGEDLWAAEPPSSFAAAAGANVIVNLSSRGEIVGEEESRILQVAAQSARLSAGYVLASSGGGESTTDGVYGGQNLIAEKGKILAKTPLFAGEIAISELDLEALSLARARGEFYPAERKEFREIGFSLAEKPLNLTRKYAKTPFVPEGEELSRRAALILRMQAEGLKKRALFTGAKSLVLGLSGGLDSTLALLATITATDLMGLPRTAVTAVTMPCFGTTGRTYRNAVALAERLGVTLREIPVKEAVSAHLKEIGHDRVTPDVTYENAQARERTQVLMDVANLLGGLVVGTGDLSELALGWATYNGDHMSNYGVNGGIPKTLVRHIVKNYADTLAEEKTAAILRDILDTPVSPELLPPKEGEIAQKTEDLVGPYELHDFFLYPFLRRGAGPEKLYFLSRHVFPEYDGKTVKKWLTVFFRRFVGQQFKRSCLPDGVKIGSVALSPRGEWRMPSDASAAAFLTEIEPIIIEK